MKAVKLGLAAALALPPVAACTPANDSINIAAVLSLTGASSAKGERHKQAMQMAIEKLNEGGIEDIIGKPLGITLVNSSDAAGQATATLEAMLADEDHGIAAVISSSASAHRESLRPALAAKTVHFEVSEGADNDEFLFGEERDEYDMEYSFSGRGLCYTEAIVTARFIFNKFPGARVGLMAGNDSHDVMHTQVIRAEIAALNETVDEEDRLTIVNTEASEREGGEYYLSYDVGQFQSEIESIMADGSPSVLFWHLAGDAANTRYVQDANRAGFEGALVTCGMSQTPEMLDANINGGILEYITDRLYYVNRGPPASESLTAFKNEFPEWSGNTFDTFTSAAFDAIMLVGLGLAQTGGEYGEPLIGGIVDASRPAGDVFTYDKAADALAAISGGAEINYDGPSSTLDIRNCPALNAQGVCDDPVADPLKHYVPSAFYVNAVKATDDPNQGQYQLDDTWSDNPILVE